MEVIDKLGQPDGVRIDVILAHELGRYEILEFMLQNQLAGVTVIVLTHHFSNVRISHTKLDVVIEICPGRLGKDINKILGELSRSKFQVTGTVLVVTKGMVD